MPFILEWETVFDRKGNPIAENDPDDPGGMTKFGIDKRSHPKEDIANLTKERAIEIYWNEYWLKNNIDEFSYPFGEAVFNCCVNAGRGRADKILAKAKTATGFIDEQESFYHRLVDAKPKSKKYLKGWLNRTEALRKYLKLA